jgi:F5/8 type C domain
VADLVFTFARDGVTTLPLTINFGVSGTAIFGTDYTTSGAATFGATAGSVTILAGQATAAVTVSPVADAIIEPNESVILTLLNAATYAVATTPGVVGAIIDDDAGVTLTYVSNGDSNGLIYYLGTSGLTTTFANPVPAGLTILASSSYVGTSPDALTNRDTTLWASANTPLQWVAIDLGAGKSIDLRDYTLQARSDNNSAMPRNWELQGTNSVSVWSVVGVESASWAVLDIQTNQLNMSVAGDFFHTGYPSNKPSYRYLRLIQTGYNSEPFPSTSRDLFILGEIEFYGQYHP